MGTKTLKPEDPRYKDDQRVYKDLADRIKAEIKSFDAKAAYPKNEEFNCMLDWMKAEGAEFSKLKIHHESETNRIVKAARDIKNGEIVLLIPDPVLIKLRDAHANPIGKAI